MRNRIGVAAALLVGAFVGFFAAREVGPRLDPTEELVSCELGNTGSTLLALRELRSGSTQGAIVLLESALSVHVAVLDEWGRELEPRNARQATRLLYAVAAYRSRHPYSSDVAEADERVASILSRYARQEQPAR